jgi:hypothetical protein
LARILRRCSALKTIKRSVHSRRIDPIKRSTYPFCQGERNEVGRSRMPIARTRALNATPNARSLSRMRYFGALSHGNASVIWRASHSAVGFRVTAIHNSRRRPWPRTRNANSCSKAIVGHDIENRCCRIRPCRRRARHRPARPPAGGSACRRSSRFLRMPPWSQARSRHESTARAIALQKAERYLFESLQPLGAQ